MKTVNFTLYSYQSEPDYREAIETARKLLDDGSTQVSRCYVQLQDTICRWNYESNIPEFEFSFFGSED